MYYQSSDVLFPFFRYACTLFQCHWQRGGRIAQLVQECASSWICAHGEEQNRRSGGRHKWRSRLRLKSQSDTASKETWELLNALFNQEPINRLREKISGMGGNAHRKKHKERKSIKFCWNLITAGKAQKSMHHQQPRDEGWARFCVFLPWQ